jgi:hypothetical protein
MRAVAKVGIALGVASLCGCVFYPARVAYYDEQCQVRSHKLRLEAEVISNLNDCDGEKAEACLVVIAAIGSVTAVVSGSIVIVGNTLYWLERRGACASRFT